MKFLSFAFLAFLMTIVYSTNSIASVESTSTSYKLNDAAVEEMFMASDDITFTADIASFMMPQQEQLQDNDEQLIAGIVAIAELILGVGILIPIHRLILGTGNEAGKIIGLYCITLGGCGWITLIDGIMLLMDSHGNQYIDNPKFIMWH